MLTGNDGNNVFIGGRDNTLYRGYSFDALRCGDGSNTFIFKDEDIEFKNKLYHGSDIERLVDSKLGENTILIDVSTVDQTKFHSNDDLAFKHISTATPTFSTALLMD